MDLTHKGYTTPKHGKRIENRLYSKFRRGRLMKDDNRPSQLNPDASIYVAAVCGREVTIFNDKKHGRRAVQWRNFPHRGAAVLFAIEHDEAERAARAWRQGAVED